MASPPVSPGLPFDAVLLISFGGPQGPADVRPFLENVVRGRPVPPRRLEEVVRNYQRFGGVSPLTALTQRQADALGEALLRRGIGLPVYVGMRNWHPFLADTLGRMSRAGVRRAIGFIAAPHHGYSSCEQYKQNVIDARRVLLDSGWPDIQVTYVESWFDHPGFIATLAGHVRRALEQLDSGLGREGRIVFTAHSIPTALAAACRYSEQLAVTAQRVAVELGCQDYALVYQSRSGRPQDPWLGPDILEYLRTLPGQGVKAVVLSPIGFVCDHLEVLFDLDVQAADLCRELNLPMVRAETANDDPMFIEMMAEVVERTYRRFERFPSLPIIAAGPLPIVAAKPAL